MSIDIPKIIYIYVIILVIMYVCIIQGNIVQNVSSFTDRKDASNSDVSLETDYNGKKFALIYLKNFMNKLSYLKEEELSSYFDDEYYKAYSVDIKKALSSKARIKDTKNNESYIDIVKSSVNENGQNVYVYNVLAVKKGLDYPESFSALSEEESVDKNKSIDIYVVEISPYNYVLQIPEKEFV